MTLLHIHYPVGFFFVSFLFLTIFQIVACANLWSNLVLNIRVSLYHQKRSRGSIFFITHRTCSPSGSPESLVFSALVIFFSSSASGSLSAAASEKMRHRVQNTHVHLVVEDHTCVTVLTFQTSVLLFCILAIFYASRWSQQNPSLHPPLHGSSFANLSAPLPTSWWSLPASA